MPNDHNKVSITILSVLHFFSECYVISITILAENWWNKVMMPKACVHRQEIRN